MKGIIVFDFDRTMIEENSDTYVIEQLCPSLWDIRKVLLKAFPAWTDYINENLRQLHEKGIDASQVKACLEQIKIPSYMTESILSLSEAGFDLRILSDANDLYIRWILEANGLGGIFKHIATNSAAIQDGLLQIKGYHNSVHDIEEHGGGVYFSLRGLPGKTHHCLNRCPENLCKGKVLKRWKALNKTLPFVYLGDGSGDFCPTLKLKEHDTVLARKDFPLHNKIIASPDKIKAQVSIWESALDVYKWVQENLRGAIHDRDFDQASLNRSSHSHLIL